MGKATGTGLEATARVHTKRPHQTHTKDESIIHNALIYMMFLDNLPRYRILHVCDLCLPGVDMRGAARLVCTQR